MFVPFSCVISEFVVAVVVRVADEFVIDVHDAGEFVVVVRVVGKFAVVVSNVDPYLVESTTFGGDAYSRRSEVA